MTLQRLTTHTELVRTSGNSGFVRYDLPVTLEGPAYAHGTAIAVPRRTHTRRIGLLVMGAAADVDELVGGMLRQQLLPAELASVTVQRDALDSVARHLALSDGNEWEWMSSTSAPSPVPVEERLVPLSQKEIRDIERLLGVANPGTDARPFQFPDQRWLGVRDSAGTLVACGVREPNLAGWPVLSGITVHPEHRGTGLGLAVTARLTREAVRERGVCTLGLYSHNAVARRLYTGLGYDDVHLWSSRRLR
ncbi:GNAT family N-acetyltransferase [Pedococcus sp. 5OH_020]|uniref:GNAT family N-acetyltransferase n=1 Tax=Pedococcus sp. 5OH_020 TaxID=2989814 RepID=UPI0022E9EF0C|nr:GNAT family N-acetyltransferase [Pedococcus sp. 5OH_020]